MSMASVDGMLSLRDQLRDSNLDQAKETLAKVRQKSNIEMYFRIYLCMNAFLNLCNLYTMMMIIMSIKVYNKIDNIDISFFII